MEPWVPPCVLFGWWFSPWEFWEGTAWFILLFLLWGCKPLQVPLVLSIIPPLGTPLRTLCSVQWLAVSIHLCICQALAESLRRQPYQVLISKHFLAYTIVSEFGDCIWDKSPGGAVSGWPFFQSLLLTLSPYFLL